MRPATPFCGARGDTVVGMSLRHAILGFIALRPMSGYELKRHFDSSVSHFWNADQSQIYRTLGRLVDDGLATRRTVAQDDRPNMHVHEATALGLDELDRWQAAELEREPERNAFLVHVFFTDRMDDAARRDLFRRRREAVLAAISALESVDVEQEPDSTAAALRLATRDHGVVQARAELEWIDAILRRLETPPA